MSLPKQLPTPYGFRDIAPTRFSNSMLLRQGQRSNQDLSMILHTYTPPPPKMSILSIIFLHIMVSEIQTEQTFPSQI